MSESRAHRPPTQKGLAFLGAVAGGLVHEVRNPLSTMNVTLQLLQEDWPEGEGGDRERRLSRRLRTLRAEVSRLEEILDDFLRYAGIRQLNLSRVDLNRVLEDVTGFIAPECARAEVDLLFYPDRALPIMRLDERLVKQAVLNLFLNALQAMESAAKAADADTSRVDGHKLIVRTGIEGDFARIDVIDTGPGIPEEIQDRVWEVYFSRRRQGSGLGLPTARRIAEEHGGDLRFETEVGKGTDFILRLPLAGPPGEDEAS
ncbi:MAG: ATP-binding protein [Planctomycetota bacterium]|nr:ATP-binding protein [Planctomycetota bacterium]